MNDSDEGGKISSRGMQWSNEMVAKELDEWTMYSL